MDVTIEITGNFTARVQDVAHPVHAINRLRKFLEENNFAIGVDSSFGYKPASPISLDFDEMEIAGRLDVEKHVTEPSTWLDKVEVETIESMLWMLEKPTAQRLKDLIAENNIV